MPLPIATLTAMALSCAPAVAPETIAAIAEQESHGNPLAINDNATHEALFPETEQDFLHQAIARLRAGHRLALGLMQISTGNFNWLDLTLEDVADPCKSMAAGAAVLTSLSRYNSGSPALALGYGQKVYAIEHHLRARVSAQTRPAKEQPVADWNVFPDGAQAKADFITEGEQK
jgi:type IV secretion system protein VirB1